MHQLAPNPFQHALEILVQFVVPVSDYAKAVILQIGRPCPVCRSVLYCPVLTAIEFDNELFLETDKINDVRPNGLLAPEFEARKAAVAERIPKLALDIRLLAAKLPGEVVFHSPLTSKI